MKKFSKAFTLLELLAVIAIIALLASLVLAVTQRVQRSARATQCLQNLRQIGVAAQAFANDNDGLLPQSDHQGPGQSWTTTLKSYLPATAGFRSPLDKLANRAVSYALNDFLTKAPAGAKDLDFSRRVNVVSPASTLFFSVCTVEQGESDHFHFADAKSGGFSPQAFAGQVEAELVNGAGHYLFVDGHAETRLWKIVTAELTRADSVFIRPQ